MSQYAVQALIMAAADDPGLKAKLQDPAQYPEVVRDILSLTPQDEEDLKRALTTEDDRGMVAAETDTRVNPGAGIMGI